jgi:intracellular sulfur oxidation DsrE/DsrF family protein
MRLLPRLLAAAVLAMPLAAAPAAAQDTPAKLLTVVTSPDAETQAMALVLSNQVAAKGGTVEVLLCGPGGDIARREAPAAATETITPTGMTVRSLLEGVMAKGGTDVCAIYLPNRDLQADALMDGVGVAKPPVVAETMMDPATKLFGF